MTTNSQPGDTLPTEPAAPDRGPTARLGMGMRLHLTLWLAVAVVTAAHPSFLPGGPLRRLTIAGALAGLALALWRSRRSERVALTLLNVASLAVFAVVLLEITLTGSQIEPSRYPYPYRDHGFAPNRRSEDNHHGVSTNDTGMRAPGPIARKRPGELRILVLGGSAILGIGSGDAHSPPAVLERLLRAELASTPRAGVDAVTVVNGGQGWYNSTQELVYFVTELALYEPDMVLVVDGYNDVHHSLVWGYPPPLNAVQAGTYSGLHTTPGLMTDRPTWGQAMQQVVSASWVAQRLGVAPYFLFAGDPRLQQTGVSSAPDAMRLIEPMRQRLLMNWTLFHRLGAGLGLPVRFALQPTIYPKRRSAEEEAWLATQSYAPMMTAQWADLERWLGDETSKLGIPTFSSDTYLRDDPGRFFSDYCHLTPEGNERLARRLAEVVREALEAGWPWSVRWDGVRYEAERGDPFFRPGAKPDVDWR